MNHRKAEAAIQLVEQIAKMTTSSSWAIHGPGGQEINAPVCLSRLIVDAREVIQIADDPAPARPHQVIKFTLCDENGVTL